MAIKGTLGSKNILYILNNSDWKKREREKDRSEKVRKEKHFTVLMRKIKMVVIWCYLADKGKMMRWDDDILDGWQKDK